MNSQNRDATTSAVQNKSEADPFLATPAASPEANRSIDVDVGQFASDHCHSDQDHDAPAGGLLNFADVPGQLSHLPFNPGSSNPSTYAPDPNSSSLTSSSSAIDTTTTNFASPTTTVSTTNTTPSASVAVTPSATAKTTSTSTNALYPFPTPTSPLPDWLQD
jgi:hypothetical protein